MLLCTVYGDISIAHRILFGIETETDLTDVCKKGSFINDIILNRGGGCIDQEGGGGGGGVQNGKKA